MLAFELKWSIFGGLLIWASVAPLVRCSWCARVNVSFTSDIIFIAQIKRIAAIPNQRQIGAVVYYLFFLFCGSKYPQKIHHAVRIITVTLIQISNANHYLDCEVTIQSSLRNSNPELNPGKTLSGEITKDQ